MIESEAEVLLSVATNVCGSISSRIAATSWSDSGDSTRKDVICDVLKFDPVRGLLVMLEAQCENIGHYNESNVSLEPKKRIVSINAPVASNNHWTSRYRYKTQI